MNDYKLYIDTAGNDKPAYAGAILKACAIAEADSEIKRVILYIQTKSHTSYFNEVLKPETIKQLNGPGTHLKACKTLFKFETHKTYSDGFEASDILIACGCKSEDVFKLDDLYSAKYIIAIPWIKNELNEWVQTWEASELRGKPAVRYPEPSCIVKTALQNLTSTIGTDNPLSHKSDVELAKTFIRTLFQFEDNLNAQIVKSYLVANCGWENREASEIESWINKLNNGESFKGGDKTKLKWRFDNWKEECK